jgi:hypothetical protein
MQQEVKLLKDSLRDILPKFCATCGDSANVEALFDVGNRGKKLLKLKLNGIHAKTNLVLKK